MNQQTRNNRAQGKKPGKKIRSVFMSWRVIIEVGFFGGLLGGGIKLLEYYFQFTKIPPGFLVASFLGLTFHKKNLPGFFLGWGVFIVLSLLASALYALLLRKAKSPYYGLLYGAAWWVLLYLVVRPLARTNYPVERMDLNTLISDCCLFLLWGLFIGFSISFEYTDQQAYEPTKESSMPKKKFLKELKKNMVK